MESTEINEILNGLRVIVQALRVSSRHAEKQVGLSGAQLFVLEKLSDVPSLSLNALAERTHTHQSSVSVVVTKLVRRKLVKRQRSESDGRKLVLSLTEAGRNRLTKSPKTAQNELLIALRKMSAKELGSLASSLSHLIQLAEISDRTPTLFFEGSIPERAPRKRTHRTRAKTNAS